MTNSFDGFGWEGNCLVWFFVCLDRGHYDGVDGGGNNQVLQGCQFLKEIDDVSNSYCKGLLVKIHLKVTATNRRGQERSISF